MATGLSPNQIASIARAQVAAALNPQVQALRNQGQITDQQLTQQAQNARDAYNAVATLMRNLSGDVQAPYTQAAQTQATFGKGFSQQFNQDTQAAADQANQLLAQNNSPAHIAAPTGQADVLYGLGGYGPATVLNTTGAALASAAANRPVNTRLMGVQAYQSGLGKVAQNDLQTGANVAKLLSTAPGLEQTAIGQINSAINDQTRLGIELGKAGQPHFFGSSTGGYFAFDPTTGKITNVVKGKGPSPKVFGSAAGGYYTIDPTTGAVTQIVSPNPTASATKMQHVTVNGHAYTFDPSSGLYYDPATGKPVAPTAKAAKAMYTPIQISKFKNQAASWAKLAWEGQYDKKTKTWVSQPVTYQQALQTITDHGVPMYLAQLALKRYWSQPGMDMNPALRASATQSNKPIVPTWAKSDTGPIYARGQGAKVYKAGKVLAAQGAATNDPVAQKVIGLAEQALGTPYVWGGSRPGGFDCSGLLYYVWGRAGVQIPRTTYDQWSAGVPVTTLQPGDAVFFKGSDSIVRGGQLLPGHVAMYVGDGKIIEAYGRGVPVRITTLAGRNDVMGARRFG